MAYVDGFVVGYRSSKSKPTWSSRAKPGRFGRRMAPLAVVEGIGDDAPYGELTPGSNATCQTCRSTAAHDLRRIRDVTAAIAMPGVG